MNFYQTQMGRKFFTADVPAAISALVSIASSLQKLTFTPPNAITGHSMTRRVSSTKQNTYLPFVSFEIPFKENFAPGECDDAFGYISIDGYPEDEREGGGVVAEVWLTQKGDFIVFWHDNGYSTNETVVGLIQEAKTILLEDFTERAK